MLEDMINTTDNNNKRTASATEWYPELLQGIKIVESAIEYVGVQWGSLHFLLWYPFPAGVHDEGWAMRKRRARIAKYWCAMPGGGCTMLR